MRIAAPILGSFKRAPARRTMQERLTDMRPIAGGDGTDVLEAPEQTGEAIAEPRGDGIEAPLGTTAELASDGDPPPDDGELPSRWEGTIVLEGVRTSDFRQIKEGALSWRPLPLPLMFQRQTAGGHAESVMAGSIETLERQDDGRIVGSGPIDLGSEDGREFARQLRDGFLRWVSADISVEEWELIEEGDCELDDLLFGGGEDCVIVEQVNKGDVMGATAVYFPAFEDATIQPSNAMVAAAGDGRRAIRAWPVELNASSETVQALTAALEVGPNDPPAEWFSDPQLDGPTPFTVTDEGRVFGHLALWGTCHIGRDDVCIEPPHSMNGYANFRTGEAKPQGQSIAVGQITMGTGHAPLNLGSNETVRHYDDTGAAVADVVVGEDEFGAWVAGALAPDVDELQVRRLRASALSGDWRRVGGNLELVAILAVNVPGFPVTRAHTLVASGEQLALTAALGPRESGALNLEARLARVENEQARQARMLEPLRPTITAALMSRIRKGGKPEA